MAGIVEVGNVQPVKPCAKARNAILMARALGRRLLEMGQGRAGAGRKRGRQRGREDEARREAAHVIAQGFGGRDIAAQHAVGFGERALDHCQPVAQAFALGDAAAARAIHADRMHFVEIGHGAIRVRHVAQFGDGRDVAVHRIDRFKHHDLGACGIEILQPALKIARIVVREQALFGPRMAYAFNHRGVIALIRNHDAIGQASGQRAKARPVRDVTGREQQRGFLVVQIGKLALQQHMMMAGARDVARAARACARLVNRIMHGREHFGMLAHAKIIVGAPDGDVAHAVRPMVRRLGKRACSALQIGEHAVAAFTT